MPWKVNGERWHLGDKGFPPGKQVRWERGLLSQLLDLVRKLEPNIEIAWTAHDAILLRVPGITRAWAQLRTKDPAGLDCRFHARKGQFNLAQLEPLGVSPRIDGHRADTDILHFLFQQPGHLHPARLKELLAEDLSGFREGSTKR